MAPLLEEEEEEVVVSDDDEMAVGFGETLLEKRGVSDDDTEDP